MLTDRPGGKQIQRRLFCLLVANVESSPERHPMRLVTHSSDSAGTDENSLAAAFVKTRPTFISENSLRPGLTKKLCMACEDLEFLTNFLGLSDDSIRFWGLGGSGETLGRSGEVWGAVGRSGRGPKFLSARAS